MADHGAYRGLYCSLFDNDDFQALSSQARHVLLTLRLCRDAGPAAIFRYYPGTLMAQTGYDEATITGALRELEASPSSEEPWIVRDGFVIWIRNGLRYDPSVKPEKNRKHATAVIKAVAALPRRPIVLAFCRYYGVDVPGGKPLDSPSIAMPPLPFPPTPPNPLPSETETESETEIRDRSKETESETEGGVQRGGAASPTGSVPGLSRDQGAEEPLGGAEVHRRCVACGFDWLGGPRCPRQGAHGRPSRVRAVLPEVLAALPAETARSPGPGRG